MKRQQVISRFFTTTPSSPSSASTQIAPSSPSVPNAGTVEWPPGGRRTLKSKPFPSSSSKMVGTDHINGRSSPTFKRGSEEDKSEAHPRRKRPRLVQKDSSLSLDVAGESVMIQEFQSDDVDNDPMVCESDLEVLPIEDDRPDESLAVEVSDSPAASSRTKDFSQGEDLPENQLKIFEGALRSDAKQSKASSSQGRRSIIPASDPAAKHKLFVEKLLARIDEHGNVKKPWHRSPPTVIEKLTPLEVQIVELKAKYSDVVLMVEVGYRYRFFGDDAETAARTLGIFAHYDHNFLTASIPTHRLHFHVRRLVQAGLKVGVVRQTETAAIKAHGSNKAGPFTRGLSALYTRATIDAAEDLGGGRPEDSTPGLSSYLMCVAERPIQAAKTTHSKKSKTLKHEEMGSQTDIGAGNGSYDTELGVVAVETATGDVMFGNFKDTVVRTELEARLITCSPSELLLASPLSSTTEKLLLDFAGRPSEVRVERISGDCFKDGGALAEVLDFYAKKDDNQESDVEETKGDKVDKGLEVVMAMPDIVVQALALALRYLQQFNLEKVLRLGAVFRPFSCHNEMNLSPNSLRQLEILKNNTDGSGKGSLLWLMDHTQTAFGARLLRYWVTHPLCDHALIAARLDAVTEIARSMGSLGPAQIEGTFPSSGKGGGIAGGASRGQSFVAGRPLQQQGGSIGGLLTILGRLPDLERGITRIFHRTATTAEFVTVIQALITSAKHLQRLQFLEPDVDGAMEEGTEVEQFKFIRSSLLQRLVSAISSAMLCEHATRLLSALNTDAATKGDKLNLFNCTDGRFPEVAECRHAIKAAEKELDGYLPTFRRLVRNPKLQYISINGVSHLVEAPALQRVPANWMKVNGTKKTTRYHPPEVLESRDKLVLAQEELAAACMRAWEMFLAEFSSHYVDFRASVQALAALDCLHSLAIVSRNQGYTRPEFVGEAEPSQLMIESGRHPILDSTLQDAFVPNDTFLGGLQERCQIITGPNMGGKSCYIRQVALIAIMAQVGSYVPASSAKLHVFDSVQTRMGASDSLQKGQSTFFEELSETSTILRTATSRSLVILDELGRGTSTHDGAAIAYATLQYLLKETGCLTLFVTHYPKIAELKDQFPGQVNPYYVSYMAHEAAAAPTELALLDTTEGVDSLSEASQSITFLYKLVPGVAGRSFGLHVARLAQIPEACVLRAATMAAKFEKEVSNHNESRATTNYLKGAPDDGIFVGRVDDVDTESPQDFGEAQTVDIGGTRIAPATASSQAAVSSFVDSSTVETSAEPSSSRSLDFRENGSTLEAGHEYSRTEIRKCIAESELRELLSSVGDALKDAADDTAKCMSLLKDIQKQVQAAI